MGIEPHRDFLDERGRLQVVRNGRARPLKVTQTTGDESPGLEKELLSYPFNNLNKAKLL